MLDIYIIIGKVLWTYRKYSKIQVLKRLYHVTTKNLFPQTILAKIFSTIKRNTLKLDIAKNLSLNSFGTFWGNSWTKFIILDTSIVLLLVIRTYTKLRKCPKILWPWFSQGFPLLYTLPMMIQLSGKGTNFGSECKFVYKTTDQQQWEFSKVKFLRKPRIKTSAITKPWEIASFTSEKNTEN